ncbi:MAG TPA: ATP-binding protein, partial [Rectinemataceae bacterium]|nr:ATP-binding protein [Rectinemataceae bacterium]
LQSSVASLRDSWSRNLKHIYAASGAQGPSAERLVDRLRDRGRQPVPGETSLRRTKRALGRRLEAAGFHREEELAELLQSLGFEPDGAEFEAFLAGGWDPDFLDRVIDLYSAENLLAVAGVATQKMSKILRMLRLYTSIGGPGPSAPVDIADSIEEVLLVMSDQVPAGVSVERNYQTGLQASSQRELIAQVWQQLLRNALQAMGERGRLGITTRYEAGTVRVDISDTGPGISMEDAPRIFDPFFTTKEPGEGYGLGLSIARMIVESVSGSIRFETSEGGTLFTVILPIWIEGPGLETGL